MDLKEQNRCRLWYGCLGLALLLMVSTVAVSTEEGGNYKEQAKESKEASESWVDWAKDKISEGLRLKGSSEDSSNSAAPNKASESAKAAKDKVQDVASGSVRSIVYFLIHLRC